MNQQSIFNDTFFAMGTRCDVVFTQIEPEFAEQVFHIIKNEVVRLENRMSRFIDDSPISQLNQVGKNSWTPVEDDIWEILSICYDFWQMSNGAFDITAAPIIRLWKEKGNPTELEIEMAKQISGFDKVDFDFENQKIRFKTDGVEFDLGAIGKGIALDSIKPILQNQGVKNAIVSFGESSILALGTHPNGENWPLGIRNIYKASEYIHVFLTSNETITSSGAIVNNDEGEVELRKHIISPASAYPIETNKTVSVKSDSATLGEFLSTTWLVLPENDQVLLSDKMKNIEILEVEYSEKKEYKTKLTLL